MKIGSGAVGKRFPLSKEAYFKQKVAGLSLKNVFLNFFLLR